MGVVNMVNVNKTEQITLSTEELIEMLLTWIPNRMIPLISGAPGVGKTQVCFHVSHDILKRDTIFLHPAISLPEDFKGMGAIVHEQAEFLAFGDLRRILEASKPTTVIIDDIGQSPKTVQAALMQLIHGGILNGHQIPDCVSFILCTNRKADKAGVESILEPIKSRCHGSVELVPSAEGFCRWGITHGIVPEIIAFLRFRPNLILDFTPSSDMTISVNPRTIHHVSDIIKCNMRGVLEHKLMIAALGEGWVAEFQGFRKVFQDLPNLDTVITNPMAAPIPGADKPSVLYAVVTALSCRANRATFDNIYTYFKRLPIEFMLLGVNDCINKDETLKETFAYSDFCLKYSAVQY
jgi:hypothetical protein